MNEPRAENPEQKAEQDPDLEAEVLMGRMIDGEADGEDRRRFEYLAASEPSLWRQLALRQQDMELLAERVGEAVSVAERTELPRAWLFPRRLSWTLALSGWAAVVIIGLSWAMMLLSGGETEPTVVSEQFTPEEHYSRYLRAPYVLGDMPPEVVDIAVLSDGRVAVHLIRQTEEVAFLDPSQALPVDADGRLTRDPAKLRQSEPRVGFGEPGVK